MTPDVTPGRARVAVAAGAGTAALAMLAGAMSVAPAQATSTKKAAEHCVVDAATGGQNCFKSFAEAVDAASGGRLDDAPASARTAAGDAGFRTETNQLAASGDARAAGEVISGTFFDEDTFGGASLTVTGSGLCEKDGYVDHRIDFSEEWKNRVSSVQPWGNCSLWLHPEPGLGGDRDGPFDENTPDIGTLMNDRAQSAGFS